MVNRKKKANGVKTEKKPAIKNEKSTNGEDDDVIIIVEEEEDDFRPKRKKNNQATTSQETKRIKVEKEVVKVEKKEVIKVENCSTEMIKCEAKIADSIRTELIFLHTETSTANFCMNENDVKDLLKLSTHNSQSDLRVDMYLRNFTDAINTVIARDEFSYILNEFDVDTIKKFMNLKYENRIIYVRLFQRKQTWHTIDSINYLNRERDEETEESSEIAISDATRIKTEACLDELVNEKFLFDASQIESYEEILDLLKLPQLKQLAKECHVKNVNQKISVRSEYVQLILDHFRNQKSLFSLKSFFVNQDKSKSQQEQTKSQVNPTFMKHCKKILGKCYRINKEFSDTFIRILMLYSLSTTNHVDLMNGKEMGQQLLQNILMVRMGKVKFVDYVINFSRRIYENREAFLNYQKALELKYELLNYVDRKEYDRAFSRFDPLISEIKKVVCNPTLIDYDLTLPGYLRAYKCGSVYVRLLGIYANEVLQKLRKYREANELFEYLLFEQRSYGLGSKAKWYERLSLNYEAHLADPVRAFEAIKAALGDAHVKKAGRLSMHQRLVKMANTKRYAKLKGEEFAELVDKLCDEEKFEFCEAPTLEIEGTVLDMEIIPGRKTIFIQNYYDKKQVSRASSSSSLSETEVVVEEKVAKVAQGRYNISVEEVAMKHYMEQLGFTNGKHSETSVLMTLYGLLFWDIIFDQSVTNVFIDSFQSAPLDISSADFFANREKKINERLAEIESDPLDFLCERMATIWLTCNGLANSFVHWQLFESVDELTSLVKCFSNGQLRALCEYIVRNYANCHSGGPDLVMWSVNESKVKFVEVKGPGDRLSYKQKIWLDFFIRNSIDCEVCYVKAKKSKRLS